MSGDETVAGTLACVGGPSADWRDGDSYASLRGMDRTGWAWEWLRRDPGFTAAAGRMPLPVSPPVQSGTRRRRHETGQPRIVRIEGSGFMEDRSVFFHRRYFVPVNVGVLAP